MRKMLLKLSSTVFPITLHPTYQLLGWMGSWIMWPPQRPSLDQGVWTIGADDGWPRMVTINLILLVSFALHRGEKPYVKDRPLNL